MIFGRIALLITMILMSLQMVAQEPPAPDSADTNPCGTTTGGNTGPGVPPPPGLCLPINDYIFPVLIGGIIIGSARFWILESRRAKAEG